MQYFIVTEYKLYTVSRKKEANSFLRITLTNVAAVS